MTAVTQTRMNVDQFIAWAEARPGRDELYNGVIYAMSPEGAGHAKVKLRMQVALVEAVRKSGVPCHVLPDGMTVRVDEHTAHEPDAQVYCGQELPFDAIEVPNPVIVVEVLSPSTRHIDASVKLAGYFRLPSVVHYLIIDPNKPLVVHHARSPDGTIVTRVANEGTIALDPPGLTLALADVYGAE